MTYDSTRGNASLRHEINNSLTLISSRLQLLAARYDFLKEDSDFTEIQNDLSDIQRLLNYDRTARQPQLTLCSLQPLLNELYTSFLPVLHAQHIALYLHIAPNLPAIRADLSLIRQALINLLKNAIQAIGDQPDGQIDIQVYCNETEEVLIEIKNNGPVIPPEIVEHIFIPFFTTKEGGSGIGLSISRQIMRLSGGSLTLLPDNKETKFILKFK